jgi:hypothetical protein
VLIKSEQWRKQTQVNWTNCRIHGPSENTVFNSNFNGIQIINNSPIRVRKFLTNSNQGYKSNT